MGRGWYGVTPRYALSSVCVVIDPKDVVPPDERLGDGTAEQSVLDKVDEIVQMPSQRKFVRNFAARVLEKGDSDETRVAAVMDSFGGAKRPQFYRDEKMALRKANTLLQKKPWINQALELLFEAAGVTANQAAIEQVSLIKHENPQVKQRALDRYWELTVPKGTQKVDIRSVSLMGVFDSKEPAPIDVRKLDEDDA